MENIPIPDLSNEIYFQTTRASGPGGQNVNKVSSKVELYFDINASQLLNEWQKAQLFQKLPSNISNEGIFRIVCQKDRSQLKNKEIVVEKFYEKLKSAFLKQKERKATRPNKAAINERIKEKKERTNIKMYRKKNFDTEE